MKGRQRRSASHVDDRGCVDADAAEALAGTNVIEAADLTQNAVNDVVDTLADTTVFPTVFTDRTPSTCPRCLGTTRCTTPSPRTRAPRLNRSLTTSAILAAAGAALTDVVRVGIVTRDLQRDRPVFNQVWAERFGEHRPARSAIQTPDLGRKARTPGS
jgi:hypothetical protein